MGVADTRGDDGLVQLVQGMARQGDMPARGQNLARQKLGKGDQAELMDARVGLILQESELSQLQQQKILSLITIK